ASPHVSVGRVMFGNQRIKKWLVKQAFEQQVSPSCPPSAPSETMPLPSHYYSDETGSSCSTCSSVERHFHQGRAHRPSYSPGSVDYHRSRSHAGNTPLVRGRAGYDEYRGSYDQPSGRLRSYSNDDVSSQSRWRQADYNDQYGPTTHQEGYYPDQEMHNGHYYDNPPAGATYP